ncbi:MAG TPA: Gldg family protein [Tepidisphaeraceae bacterium]|jgi:hypothetical protein|nr:Gldg family protein [Tepidisphaeraceae bacterium]
MSSKNKNRIADLEPARPESQKDRWIKYGSNVVLSAVLIVALAVMLTWFSQRANARVDMTAGGSLSLKPQTLNVIKDLKQKITLVSLYSKPDNMPEQAALAQRVSDLLDEYKNKSGKIDVQVIDPIKEKDKLEELHQQFISRYGSQIKVYKDYLDDWRKQYDQIKKLTDAEADAIKKFSASDEPGADSQQSSIADFVRTIHDVLPERLNDARTAVDRELKKKHPDYKGATTVAKEQMENVSTLAGAVVDQLPLIQQSKEVPAEFKKYLADSVPNYEKIKKLADDAIEKAGKLGELKVDQLEQALNVENPILVLGENDWRILSQRQVWQDDTDARALNAGAKVTPRFAGEQQVTTAIYGLEHPIKQKICFVRGGGPPVTAAGFPPFIPSGAMSTIAEQFREYNFDVTEKDLSGQWAMQQQMQRQQMPSAPEPSDDQIRDAIWVVLDLPQEQQQGMPPQPSAIGPRLKEHLGHGGSALLLVNVRGDNLADTLKDWGVDVHSDAIAMHETITVTDAAAADPVEEAKARPFIWDIRRYGDHPLVAPINNLDSVYVAPIVVNTHDVKGCTVTPILPFSANMPGLKTWGDVNLDQIDQGKPPEFHPEKGDLAPPVWGGAVVEKQGAGRLVVIGSVQSFTNGFLRILDPRLARRDPPLRVNRFPGNQELATNSIFWLAHLETMIAISPAAMDVSRIGDMSNGVLNFWRIGVLLIILPGAVLVAGAGVYFKRRD